jgi:hypothetical protein
LNHPAFTIADVHAHAETCLAMLDPIEPVDGLGSNVVLIDGEPAALLLASNDPRVTEVGLDLLRVKFGYEPDSP